MGFEPEKLLRKGIETLDIYVPGRRAEEVGREYGLTEVLKLASNENANGPSPAALEAIQGVLKGLNRYPDGHAGVLRAALAERLGVEEAQIFIGNGGDDVLSVLSRTFLNDGDEVIIPQPTFSPYRHVSRVMGAKVVLSPLRDYRIDLDDIASRASGRSKLIFLCSPNNPTGTILEKKALVSFLEALPENTLVLLDEAYGDFVDDPEWPDSLALIEQYPLIVLRSFSKIYGLAGLRVGYGIGNKELIGFMHRVREPFNVNQLAQVAAVAALGDEGFRESSIRMNREERQKYYLVFRELGIAFIESQANFIFINVRNGDAVTEALLKLGLIVRPGSAFGCPEWIRVTIGTPEENTGLSAGLWNALSGA
ncbi:MAG: histidinol-phosphate transaminase [Nitrospinaceae bacterium]|nr:histidinol-phosphate transaminase [Nitrospinaceae bacterium]